MLPLDCTELHNIIKRDLKIPFSYGCFSTFLLCGFRLEESRVLVTRPRTHQNLTFLPLPVCPTVFPPSASQHWREERLVCNHLPCYHANGWSGFTVRHTFTWVLTDFVRSTFSYHISKKG